MPNITTLDDLRSQDEGTTVNIGSATWTVRPGGLALNAVPTSATVPFEEFTGSIASNRVTVGPIYVRGTWFTNSANHYLVLAEGANDQVWMACVDNVGRFRHRTQYGYSTITSLRQADVEREIPEHTQRMSTLLLQHHDLSVTVEEQAERERSAPMLTPEAPRFPEGFVERLHEAMNDDDTDRGSETDSLLEEFGVGRERPTETFSVDVMVHGQTTIDLAVAERLVHESRVVDLDERPTLDWDHRVSVNVTGSEGECGCHLVDYDLVASGLRDESITFTSFDYEVEDCENC